MKVKHSLPLSPEYRQKIQISRSEKRDTSIRYFPSKVRSRHPSKKRSERRRDRGCAARLEIPKSLPKRDLAVFFIGPGASRGAVPSCAGRARILSPGRCRRYTCRDPWFSSLFARGPGRGHAANSSILRVRSAGDSLPSCRTLNFRNFLFFLCNIFLEVPPSDLLRVTVRF